MPIPRGVSQSIVDVHGDAGRDWVSRLPEILARTAARWELRLGEPFEDAQYAFVAPASRSNGERVVVKATPPHAAFDLEAEALRAFDGRGAARLLELDPEGILLLERVEPGGSLVSVALRDDGHATSMATGLMRELRRDALPDAAFPTEHAHTHSLRHFRARFDGGAGPLPNRLLATAEQLVSELLASSPAPVLLHGDLHHRNILAARRSPWLAIDPKGIAGDPAFEAGALLRNPIPELLVMERPERVVARRIDQVADELGLDRSRVWAWGLVQAVLAACWGYEDHGAAGFEPWFRCAELFPRAERSGG